MRRLVGWVGVEPTANGLKGHCSTTELPTRRHRRAAVTSSRLRRDSVTLPAPPLPKKLEFFGGPVKEHFGGDEGIRTPDLLLAKQAL